MIYGVEALAATSTLLTICLIWQIAENRRWRKRQTSNRSLNLQEPPYEPNYTVPVRMDFLESLLLKSLGLADRPPESAADSMQAVSQDPSDRLAWQDNKMPLSMEDSLLRERDSMAETLLRMQSRTTSQSPEMYQESEYEDQVAHLQSETTWEQEM